MKKKYLLIPKTSQEEVHKTIHGIQITDPYQWLENIKNEKVLQWVRHQNRYTHEILKNVPSRKNVTKRLRKIFQGGINGSVIKKGGRYFFEERDKIHNLPILYTQKDLKRPRKILINPNTLSRKSNITLRDWYPSPNGKLIAYNLSHAGSDQVSTHVLDVDTGKELIRDLIPSWIYPSFKSSIEWDTTNKGFWYTRRAKNAPEKTELSYHQKVYYHSLNQSFTEDKFVFGDAIAKEDIPSVHLSDRRYLLITVLKFNEIKEETALYLYQFNKPEKGFINITQGLHGLFFGFIHKDMLYIRTNYKAPLWKLVKIDISQYNAGTKKWIELIPESKLKMEKCAIVQNNLCIEYLDVVHSTLKIYSIAGNFQYDISLPAIGSIFSINSVEESNELFFSFTSFLIPPTTYSFSFENKKLNIIKSNPPLIDHNQFKIEQIRYSTHDYTKVPMSLIYKKNIVRNGKNPTLLYTYGGFNVSLMPYFNELVIPFLERGGIYAVANIRGGGEFGEKWHIAGVKKNKKNSFSDFIAAAEWLIKNQYTNSLQLAGMGWSNGGLIIGGAITQKPNLLKAAIIGFPVLDLLRYHLFCNGRQWIPEYGNPDIKKDFQYLLKYSPYHRIEKSREYPSTLILTGLHDDRVHPMHAFKMTARLQNDRASKNIVLLRTEVESGHTFAIPKKILIKEYADTLCFLFQNLHFENNEK